MNFKKKIVLIAISTILATGCFDTNNLNKEYSRELHIEKKGKNTEVMVLNQSFGVEIELNRVISADKIKTDNHFLKIVQNDNFRTKISLASKDSDIKFISFEIEDCPENLKVSVINSYKEDKLNVKRDVGDVLLGDFNNDGIVELKDFVEFAQNYGKAYNTKYDIAPAELGTTDWQNIYCKLTKDNLVNLNDFVIFAKNYSKKAPVQTFYNFYVNAINGKDTNTGGVNSPLATINKALNKCVGGELILITEGTYNTQTNILNKNFTKPITILGTENTIFDGKSTVHRAFSFENCSNIILKNINVKNYLSAGIEVMASRDITITNNSVSDCGRNSDSSHKEGYGIAVGYSDRISITGNKVYNNGPKIELINSGILGNGINTYALKDGTISNNVVYNNFGGGILVEDGTNVLTENNTITGHTSEAPLKNGTDDKWFCGGIWADGGKNNKFISNTIKNNKAGISISDLDAQVPTGYIFDRNTVSENSIGVYIRGMGEGYTISSVENNIMGNIVNVDSDNGYFYITKDMNISGTVIYQNVKYPINIKSKIRLNYGMGTVVFEFMIPDTSAVIQFSIFVLLNENGTFDIDNVGYGGSYAFMRVGENNILYEEFIYYGVGGVNISVDASNRMNINFAEDFMVREYGYFYDNSKLIGNGTSITCTIQ